MTEGTQHALMHKPLGVPALAEARDLCGPVKSGEDWSLLSGGFVAVAVLSLSHVRLFVTPWTAACQVSVSFAISQSLLTLISIESVMSSNQLILCHLLLLLPSIFPSIGVFSNELALCIRWPKYWSFSFSISTFNEYSGLISFRIDWFYLFAVQGTLKSLLQYHSSKASILRRSAFFTVQLSHPYMTTGKTITLTRHTMVAKVMSLVFNMLSRLVTTFLITLSIKLYELVRDDKGFVSLYCGIY